MDASALELYLNARAHYWTAWLSDATGADCIWLPRYRKFIPGATGLGLAFTVNGFNSVSFFIGACLAALAKRLWPKPAGKYIVPASSGIIAGESLMGVLIAFGTIFKVFR